MRIAILADDDFARREQALLSRLEVGLVDEGVRTIRLVPASASQPHDDAGPIFAPRMTYEDHSVWYFRRKRAARIADAVAHALDAPPEACLEIVHCFGQGAWSFGHDFSRRVGARLVLDVWRPDLARSAGRLLRRAAARDSTSLFVPGQAVRRAVRKEAPDAAVVTTPWGVHPGEIPHSTIDPTTPIGVVLLAGGRQRVAIGNALRALAKAAKEQPGLLVFMDAGVAAEVGAWRICRETKTLDRLSLIEDLEHRREPALRADVLIQPEAIGEHRSFTLEAMASGMLVVARADPFVEYLVDGKTAKLVQSDTQDAWHAAISGLLNDPDAAHELSESARLYIRANRTASAYVEAVLTGYRDLAAPEEEGEYAPKHPAERLAARRLGVDNPGDGLP